MLLDGVRKIRFSVIRTLLLADLYLCKKKHLMKYIAFLLLCLLAACTPQDATDTHTGPFTVAEPAAAWQMGELRIYPIYATADFVTANADVASYQTLEAALQNERFRIVEHKPFGRFADSDVVNQLTVENRSSEQVLLLSGDIVQGGRQDRAIGEDAVIAARHIQNIPVFCVEQGRSSYHNEDEEAGDQPDVYAFRGYYHVAPGHIRQQIQAGNQEGVWESVSQITSEHAATNSTSAFAGLEDAAAFTEERNAYLAHFTNLLAQDTHPQLVGLVAISGDKVIGVDVFGHPALAAQRFSSLLHGYVTEALTFGEPAQALSERRLSAIERHLNASYAANEGYHYEGNFVHLSNL